MAHVPKPPVSAGEHILDVGTDPDTQADCLERLVELARNASPEARSRLRHTIAVVARSRQIRVMACTIVQLAKEKQSSIKPGSLLLEMHSMDEETRSLTEFHMQDRARE